MFSVANPKLRWLGARGTTNALAALALGEIIADKLPFIPNRTSAAPLLGRLIGGGICGAAICASHHEDPWAGALVGGLAAIGAAYGGYELRRYAARKGKPDLAVAAIEDIVPWVEASPQSAVCGYRSAIASPPLP